MLACMAAEAKAEAVAKTVSRAGSPDVSRAASPISQTSAEEDEAREALAQGQGQAQAQGQGPAARSSRHSRQGSRDSLSEGRRPGRRSPKLDGAPSRALSPKPEGILSSIDPSAVPSTDPLGRVREAVRVTDQLLQQGALAVFLTAATSSERQLQLHASRGLKFIAMRSPLFARVLARKGAARALAALLGSAREETLRNAVTALHLITMALSEGAGREPLSAKRLSTVRGGEL